LRHHLVKRSVALGGHRTSIALEPVFWEALDQLALARGQSLAGLIATIDASRTDPETPLASLLRTTALQAALTGESPRSTAPAPPSPPPNEEPKPDP